MPYEICRHIKTNGRRCQSPALTDQFWCYFHDRLHFRHRSVLQAKRVAAPAPLLMPVLEDRESVQVAISLVAGAIATGHLDDKRTAALLKILTLANRNVGKAGDLINSAGSADAVLSFLSTLDGRDIDWRRMSDDSEPPPRTSAHTRSPQEIVPE